MKDFTQGGEQYDCVIDAAGKTSFGRCRSVLRPDGMFLTSDLGPGWQNLPLQLATTVGRGRRVMLPTPMDFDKALIEEFQELLRSGTFQPVLDDRSFDLDQIVEAYRYVESQQKIGNVLLRIDPALDREWRTVVLDEAQAIKTPTSQTARTASTFPTDSPPRLASSSSSTKTAPSSLIWRTTRRTSRWGRSRSWCRSTKTRFIRSMPP